MCDVVSAITPTNRWQNIGYIWHRKLDFRSSGVFNDPSNEPSWRFFFFFLRDIDFQVPKKDTEQNCDRLLYMSVKWPLGRFLANKSCYGVRLFADILNVRLHETMCDVAGWYSPWWPYLQALVCFRKWVWWHWHDNWLHVHTSSFGSI